MLLQSCSGSLYCQIKTQGAVSWSEFLTYHKSQSTLPSCFMCNWRSKENGDSEESPPPPKKNLLLLASAWEIWRQRWGHKEFCERACKAWWEDPAVGRAEQQTCPPIHETPPPPQHHPPPPPPPHPVPNTPPPLFTHPSEANRLQRSSSFKAGGISGTDKQPRDNPTEFSLSSWVLLPVC